MSVAPRDGDRDAFDEPGLILATLDAVPYAVIVADDAGVIVIANRQVEAVFGCVPGELAGRPVESLVPIPTRDRREHLRQGHPRGPMGQLRLTGVRRDGTEFPAEVSLAPIQSEGHTLTAATVRDISEQLHRADDADRMRDQLLTTVTHELRTPLTSILGYAELVGDLPDTELSERARELVGRIARNADRELGLINDLLSLATDSVGAVRLQRERLDLVALLGAVVRDHRRRADTSGIRLTLSVTDAPHAIHLSGDSDRLRQVFSHLLGNAVKFTPAGGSVSVEVQPLDDRVVVAVSDTGPGIDTAEQEHIFTRFFRSTRSAESHAPGAGLGLAIARQFVDAHGGAISVDSVVGKGTTMTVQLPCDQPA